MFSNSRFIVKLEEWVGMGWELVTLRLPPFHDLWQRSSLPCVVVCSPSFSTPTTFSLFFLFLCSLHHKRQRKEGKREEEEEEEGNQREGRVTVVRQPSCGGECMYSICM